MPKPVVYRLQFMDWRGKDQYIVGSDPLECMNGWPLVAVESWVERSEDAYGRETTIRPSHKVKWSNA